VPAHRVADLDFMCDPLDRWVLCRCGVRIEADPDASIGQLWNLHRGKQTKLYSVDWVGIRPATDSEVSEFLHSLDAWHRPSHTAYQSVTRGAPDLTDAFEVLSRVIALRETCTCGTKAGREACPNG